MMAHQLPSPPTTASGSGGTKRSRRTEASISSESALGQFGISNLRDRIVAPPRPLPLVTFPSASDRDSDRVKRQFGAEFEQEAWELMSKIDMGVDKPAFQVDLVARMFRDDPHDIQPTILIIVDAKWTVKLGHTWEPVVDKLKRYIDQRIADTPSTGSIDICVEMVSKVLVLPKYLTVINPGEQGSQQLINTWPHIQDGILNILESFDSTAGHMTAISLFKLGFNIDGSMNPKTIYVSVDYDSPASGWPPVLDAMQGYADTFEMDLEVHIEHNLVGHHTDFPLVPSELTAAERTTRRIDFNYELLGLYSKEVKAGSDISAGCYITRNDNKPSSPMVGTLGCWVQIKVKDKDWMTMGLTCYHVLRPCLKGYMVGAAKTQVPGLSEKVDHECMSNPAKDSACWTADIKGFTPKDMPTLEMVEHPPRIKHNFNVTDKQVHIKNLKELHQPTEAQEAELKEVLDFFNNGHQYFGRPFVASGYLQRTKTNGRLDWALIQPFDDTRVGGNSLPTVQDWRSKGYIQSQMPAKQDGCVLEPQGISIHDRVKDVTVVHDKVFGFKMGASTRCTVGELSWAKTTCTIAEEKYIAGRSQKERRSTEFVFAPVQLDPTVRFGNRGDSGAVVFDNLGRVMGLLFTGELPQQCAAGYSLVTPIEDVFANIKEFSCGQVEDIRLLGEEDTVMAST
ncbi:hypothetical protein B0T25DRAFT_576618 [Lasiosphaeria hispida]|uniref:Uncharacterized protein n=1 Tax=Lasiosphaeria hispida TaxID=260671 RepID=A0AAJ0HX73_9PEZI|nr:hypothetical protein B0T25DRAFT_576618 [Lasiosphaeria hispida]